MPTPLVTVICLCYNHSKFIREAIESVVAQAYPALQLIVVDDASTDGSVAVIQQLVNEHPSIEFLPLTQNLGNCAAFNKGLVLARGEYLIDLAADDLLLPERIAIGVNALQQAGSAYGVHFSDAEWIGEGGKHLYDHSDRFPHVTIPQGDIYKELINRYFICPPTVMFTREVISYLGGYDETLTYEDFDFWIRSSRKFNYAYSPQVLVKKRVTTGTMANKQFRVWSSDSQTTYRVCEKIFELNETRDERKALAERIGYEIKLNVRLLNFKSAVKFFFLWLRNVSLNRVAFVLLLCLMITAFTG
jgi:glycosyltransferase involved in cell wall biosynthesis